VDVSPDAPRLQFGGVTLVPDERLVLRDGQPVPMTPKAFDLLLVLAENAGRLLTKEQLMQAVWSDTAVEEANLSYHVFAIRKALGDAADNGLIATVPRRGYRFTAEVTSLGGNDRQPPGSGDEADRDQTDSACDGLPLAGVVLDGPAAAGSSSGRPSAPSHDWRPAAWLGTGVLIGIGSMLLVTLGPTAPPGAILRAQISPGVQLSEASPFALSPDGRKLVFAGSGPDGITRLWLQHMGEDEPHPLPGTERALAGLTPPMFWSPDSQTVAFDAAGQLKGFDLRDGAMRTVCALPHLAVGGSWNADGVIIVGAPSSGLFRCSGTDGVASELTRVDPDRGETTHLFPWFLPDGRHFLYVRVARNAPEGSGVYLGSLDDSPGTTPSKRLLASGFGAAYIPTKGASTGHVVFLRDATLFAQAFDERGLQLRGDPFPLASPVGSFLDGGFFSVSHEDMIAFRPPDKDFRLTWFDRQGRKTGTDGEVGRYSVVALSADDSRVAMARETVGSTIDRDIWILETSRPTSTRVTFGPVLEDAPVWSADGRKLLFTVGGDTGDLFEQDVNGEAKPRMLLSTREHKIPTSASSDGRFLLYTAESMDQSRRDIWVLPLTGERTPFALVHRAFDQDQGQFSPDGRWVAYASNESGRHEVLVRRFVTMPEGPAVLDTVVVSSNGGTAPRWRADGKELYFIAPDGAVMAADVRVGGELSVSAPRVLFRIAGSHGDWDVASDGSRFLIAMPTGADASAPFTILWNRLAQLRTATPSPHQ